jgi:hypothetical protein
LRLNDDEYRHDEQKGKPRSLEKWTNQHALLNTGEVIPHIRRGIILA